MGLTHWRRLGRHEAALEGYLGTIDMMNWASAESTAIINITFGYRRREGRTHEVSVIRIVSALGSRYEQR